jgi:homoaconitase/3-isopropylmalate dehydratase large subunit
MPGADKKPKTLYDKVLDHHIVNEQEDGTLLIYIGMLARNYHNYLKANLSQTDISSTR